MMDFWEWVSKADNLLTFGIILWMLYMWISAIIEKWREDGRSEEIDIDDEFDVRQHEDR